VPEPVLPPGVEVRRSGAEEFEQWLAVVVEASLHPDTDGLPWHDARLGPAILLLSPSATFRAESA
jgi:hypothetical protein